LRQDIVVIDIEVAPSSCGLSAYMQKTLKLPSGLVEEKLDKSKL
jgi:hypothetical protein